METQQKPLPAQYEQIAEDIARRVVEGGLATGDKLFGRSVMSSEYGVSPETIRRAFRLLADMQVIEIKPQSGACVRSVDSAKRYLARIDEIESRQNLDSRLKKLLQEHARLAKELGEVTVAISKRQETLFSAAEMGFGVGEAKIEKGAWVIGKTIAELAFWQSTGATVLAIRRGQSLIVSPGPYAELYNGDSLIFVGNDAATEKVSAFLNDAAPKEERKIDSQ